MQNRYEKEMTALVRKMRAWRNTGARGHLELVKRIRKLNALWDADQRKRLAAIEAQFDRERIARAKALAKIIEADRIRYEGTF
jgi:hypothetical protein